MAGSFRSSIIDPDGNLIFVETCEDSAVQRIDGGPIEPEGNNRESVVELRAFLVAPPWDGVFGGKIDYLDEVTDMNGDGVVGAADAELMGWTVVSNEVVYGFRQIGNQVALREADPIYTNPFIYCFDDEPNSDLTGGSDFIFDVDGNGFTLLNGGFACPGGGSGTTQPPRG